MIPIARPSRQAAHSQRSSPFRDDFVAGRYDACLTSIRGDSGLDETLMASTALRRLGREADALALLGVIEDDVVGAGDDLHCGRFCIERGAALASLGDATAGRSFGLARAFLLRADAIDAPATLAELALQEALAAWNDGERTLAISTLERAEMDAMPSTRAWARHLRGEIAASDLDFHTQLECEHATLREIAANDVADAWLEATTLQTLAHVAIELDERHVTKFARARADRLAWTSATASMEHDVYRFLSWYEALRGNRDDSRTLMTRSARVAPSDRERVTVLVDEARLAGIARDARTQERIDFAYARATATDWENASVAALETLLELAHVFAVAGDDRSADLVARHRNARRFSMSLARKQPIAVARERFWYGSIALARGERAVARGHLQHAFDFWSTVAFVPRAALAAMSLCAIGPHPGARGFLTEHLERWPGTFLHDRMRETLARESGR